MPTLNDINTGSNQVKEEVQAGANSAIRIGQLFLDIISYFEDAKVAKVQGKGLSVNDFTTALKSKVDNVPLHTINELLAKFSLSELSTLDFGINSTEWNCLNRSFLKFKAIVSADLIPAYSQHQDVQNKLIAKELTAILTVTNTCDITLPKHHFATDNLPTDVTWDDQTNILTISNANNSRYVIWGTLDEDADEWICNIQLK